MKIVEHRPEIPDFGMNTRLFRKHTLYFDIETTGLNARRSHLYLLGAMWMENKEVCLRQWFAEKPSDEETMLREFLELSRSFATLVHFNGTTFDLPYLCNKAAFYGLDAQPLKEMDTVDLYQLYRPLKAVLAAEDMKLSRLEQICGYERLDHHTGKELIRVYDDYLQTAYKQAQNTLERHNYDDIVGMVWTERLDSLLGLQQELLHPCNVAVTQTDHQMLEFHCDFNEELVSLPQPLSCGNISLEISGKCCRILTPLYKDEYYYYYKDYKNYFYLPAEDRAVHKSIGIYVDPSARKKATADTCYERKKGTFIREFTSQLIPALQGKPKKADEYYFEINDAFYSDAEMQAVYCTHVIGYLLKHI